MTKTTKRKKKIKAKAVQQLGRAAGGRRSAQPEGHCKSERTALTQPK